VFEKRVVKGRETKMEDKGKWSGGTGGRGRDLLLRQLNGEAGISRDVRNAGRGAHERPGSESRESHCAGDDPPLALPKKETRNRVVTF
jgi:hypothetical protein